MDGCPKRMVFGPCGGVRDDLGCELGDRPCPFATAPPVRWSGEPIDPAPVAAPRVLTDLTVRPFDPASVREVVGILAPVSDGLLVGEHHNRPDLPPTLFASEVLGAGGRPWTTLTCRDRNRIVLEQELVGLAALGVEGVLCVTGDARGQGVRPDVTQVFDLDGTRLAALAASLGVPAAVPEAPDAPPVGLRPGRVVDKQRAGAGLCVLNHVSSPARVAEFIAAARAAGATLPFVAAVAVYTDQRSARVLQRFAGLGLDPAAIEAVLAAADPVAAGIAAAVAEARALLAVPGVAGVNLSGLASGRGERTAAEIKAAVAAEIRATHPPASGLQPAAATGATVGGSGADGAGAAAGGRAGGTLERSGAGDRGAPAGGRAGGTLEGGGAGDRGAAAGGRAGGTVEGSGAGGAGDRGAAAGWEWRGRAGEG